MLASIWENQVEVKTQFLRDFRFRERFDSIIRNLEPLSIQYA